MYQETESIGHATVYSGSDMRFGIGIAAGLHSGSMMVGVTDVDT